MLNRRAFLLLRQEFCCESLDIIPGARSRLASLPSEVRAARRSEHAGAKRRLILHHLLTGTRFEQTMSTLLHLAPRASINDPANKSTPASAADYVERLRERFGAEQRKLESSGVYST